MHACINQVLISGTSHLAGFERAKGGNGRNISQNSFSFALRIEGGRNLNMKFGHETSSEFPNAVYCVPPNSQM